MRRGHRLGLGAFLLLGSASQLAFAGGRAWPPSTPPDPTELAQARSHLRQTFKMLGEKVPAPPVARSAHASSAASRDRNGFAASSGADKDHAARVAFLHGELFQDDMALLETLVRLGKRSTGAPLMKLAIPHASDSAGHVLTLERSAFRGSWFGVGLRGGSSVGQEGGAEARDERALIHLGLKTEADLAAAIGHVLIHYAPEDFL